MIAFECDRERTQRLLTHVLGHVVDGSSHGGSITIRGALVEGRVEIEAWNAAVERAKMAPASFTEAAQADRPESMQRGLYLTHLLADALGGDLTVERVGDAGTRMLLTLPSG